MICDGDDERVICDLTVQTKVTTWNAALGRAIAARGHAALGASRLPSRQARRALARLHHTTFVRFIAMLAAMDGRVDERPTRER